MAAIIMSLILVTPQSAENQENSKVVQRASSQRGLKSTRSASHKSIAVV